MPEMGQKGKCCSFLRFSSWLSTAFIKSRQVARCNFAGLLFNKAVTVFCQQY